MTCQINDYPVLARLAASRATAATLDERACFGLYAQATGDDLGALGPEERRFYDRITANGPDLSTVEKLTALQAQVRADGFRRMADEKAFLDDLSGEI